MTARALSPTRTAAVPSCSSALLVILTGTFMVVLDFVIVNVALPSMQAGLHAPASTLEWVAAGYALTSAVFLISSGRLGDHLGRRRVFSYGLLLFTLSSAVCGVSNTPQLLIAGRLLQGLAAAMIMPNVLSLIGALFAGPDRARALSAYGMVMGLAALGGQLLGGGSVVALVPGLLLVGCGMGLGITPLATIVLAIGGPDHVGQVSGLLATMQNVGGAIGVAMIGLIFFGTVAHGYSQAFGYSAAALCGTRSAVVALTRLLPKIQTRA